MKKEYKKSWADLADEEEDRILILWGLLIKKLLKDS